MYENVRAAGVRPNESKSFVTNPIPDSASNHFFLLLLFVFVKSCPASLQALRPSFAERGANADRHANIGRHIVTFVACNYRKNLRNVFESKSSSAITSGSANDVHTVAASSE
jgi:hypothetical protein